MSDSSDLWAVDEIEPENCMFVNRPTHPVNHQWNNLIPREAVVEAIVQVFVDVAQQDEEMEDVLMKMMGAYLVVKLSTFPHSLQELWSNSEFCTGGFKAAKDFNEKERGADKS